MSSSLRLIKEASGSSVASISLDDCFTSDFEIYKVFVTMEGFSGNHALNMRFINSSGSIVTESTSYDYSRQMIKSDSAFSNDNSSSAAFIYTGELDDDGMGQMIDVFSPYDSSVYTQMMMRTSGHAGSNWRGQFGGGALQQQSSITGVHFYSNNAGTITTIKISVYGLRES